MPATTTSLFSWGATLGAAASAAYVNRRQSQDDLDNKTNHRPRHQQPPSIKFNPHRHATRNNDIHILTFVLVKD
ncbi:uncharacterized protein BX664DRAFT_329895 [Halteromyces radiatus]|uniref:uncharacterized protein n=1 Tax=Halteromyces radiatus TaxID=101107 RepID=UPI00221F0DE0|nr:uncharacterized protein BX664DRAFT_329895 [Halteromyces radiatus]KAI8093517.1 hypothetical protein BX664DRAFT_329895 [Halteromyces radiatus]